ncbi:MAG: radical SAM protein [Deltaproteobacteria bacterium]|nr:radical SAM protein [Deltaproteobacteria bacterium]MBW2122537.1 radical SAM protein [Deltaproteobacteria bacterium]
MAFIPAYLRLYEEGELRVRIEALNRILESCTLCPRQCRVNRIRGEKGYCRAGGELMVSSVFPHFGEEPPLVGSHGSGTIFLTHCNLRCVFCQNYEISHMGRGEKITTGQMAGYMIRLQEMGCHNVNFVTPTHYTPQIVAALPEAIESGLRIPLVYNCGGYESLEVIRLLDGVIDIYMPDVKFSSSEVAGRLCNAPDYPEVVRAAVKEMHRQVGDLRIGPSGTAERGLLIRHLVMPSGQAGTDEVMRFISQELSPNSYVNVMSQYRPAYRAWEFPDASRPVTVEEFRKALEAARKYGIFRGFE